MRFLFYLLFFSFCTLNLFSSQAQAKKDLTKLSYDELKDYFYNDKLQISKKNDCAKVYLAKAKNEKSNKHITRAYYMFATMYYYEDDFKAIRYLDSVIKYSKKNQDSFFPASAYREKADLLINQFMYKDAMTNFKLAEKYAYINNPDYYYDIKISIGVAKSEKLGEVEEALKIYKECYNFYKKKKYQNDKYSDKYQTILFALADVYKSLNKLDSCSLYNKMGYLETKRTKNYYLFYMFILNEGANQTLRKNYKSALDSIDIALPKMIEFNNKGNILASFFYRGKAFQGLGKNELAAENYLKVDSMYNINKRITPEFMAGYPYLINYYKEKGDKENQLKYLNIYITIDSTLQKNYKELNKVLQNEYDTPHLMKEKEALIQSLESNKNYYYWSIVGLLFLILGLIYNQNRLNKLYKQRFNTIITTPNIKIEELSTQGVQINKKNEVPKIKEIGIADELVTQILKQLKQFEEEKGYLETNITIQSLSTRFETNSKYLSKIVNEYKEKNFTTYLNDLRIDYAVAILQKDKKIRKYNMNALANEFGFNNSESFSTAFFKKTGIKPSYFIKELEKSNNI